MDNQYMKRHIFNPIEVITFNTDYIACKPEYNTFFELVFVEKGSGYRISDDLTLPFRTNDLFLYLPSEKNSIQLNEPSVIHFIKFQRILFGRTAQSDFSISDWFTHIEFILHSNQQQAQTIVKHTDDLTVIKAIVRLIIHERDLDAAEKTINLKSLLVVLLNIVKRNILSRNAVQRTHPPSSVVQDILNYIHLHIGDPKKLPVKTIAGVFNISEKYFGEYFQTHAGISYKQYVLEYRVKAAETRLMYSNLTLSQIAFELGFTDVSHLNKTFKQVRGIYPREVRKKSITLI